MAEGLCERDGGKPHADLWAQVKCPLLCAALAVHCVQAMWTSAHAHRCQRQLMHVLGRHAHDHFVSRRESPAHSTVRGDLDYMPEEMGTSFLQVNRPSMQP